MKKQILFLNIAVIVPCFVLYAIGVEVFEPLWLMVFIISIVNACKSDTKKEFLFYSLILFVVSAAGLLAEVCFDIAHHPEWKEEIQLLMTMHIGYMLVLTVIEFLLMWIGAVMKKQPEKKIPEDTYRVIKISKDALFEFVYEQFLDNQQQFLDITDPTTIVTSYGMDWDDNSFVFIARNVKDESDFFEEIDVQKISKALTDTTATMYKENRYIDLSRNQIDDIQGEIK